MDWTTVAVALLSGGSGVLGGYLGAGRQASGALDGLRAQHREDTRRDLMQTYHQTLDHLTLFNVYSGYRPFEDVEAFDAWIQQFHHLANGIRLLGSQKAIDHVINMATEFGLACELLPDEDHYDEDDFPSFDEHLQGALRTGEERWLPSSATSPRQCATTSARPPRRHRAAGKTCADANAR